MSGPSEFCAASIPVRTGTTKMARSVLFILVLMCVPAFAQKDTGAIAGLVKDPSGAVVAGVPIEGHRPRQSPPNSNCCQDIEP